MNYFDLCPMCGLLREMNISGFRTIAVDDKGTRTAILTRAYHCRSCFCFVCAEDVDDTPENRENVLLDDEVSLVEQVDELQVKRTAPVF